MNKFGKGGRLPQTSRLYPWSSACAMNGVGPQASLFLGWRCSRKLTWLVRGPSSACSELGPDKSICPVPSHPRGWWWEAERPSHYLRGWGRVVVGGSIRYPGSEPHGASQLFCLAVGLMSLQELSAKVSAEWHLLSRSVGRHLL